MRPMRLTLGQFFALAALVVIVILGVGGWRLERRARTSIASTAKERQDRLGKRVAKQVVTEIGRAQLALEAFERQSQTASFALDDSRDLERALFRRLFDDPHLEEVTFTSPSFQVAVMRRGESAIDTRLIDHGTLFERHRGLDNMFDAVPLRPIGPTKDPTKDDTYTASIDPRYRDRAIWSDLHGSELDPRRIVLSVQKAIRRGDTLLGVARVSIDTKQLDKITASEPDQRVVIMSTSSASREPKLVARVDDSDRMVVVGDDVRFVSDHPPPELTALLASPLVRNLDLKTPTGGGPLQVSGEPWLATIQPVELGEGGTEGWMVAVLVPEARYTKDFTDFEKKLFGGAGFTLLLVVLVGFTTIVVVRRGLLRIVDSTHRMRAFDFTPSYEHSFFRDLDEVGTGLERAKTVVRAMGKYIPIDLVRRLYERNEEPRLGGELLEVSLLFTDIEGFTSLSERLPPDELARHLGEYLEAMTVAIEATGGTIDKYIGDAVMAIWNAPSQVDEDAKRACNAVLACRKAADRLYASDKWSGLPRLVTRFGLHRARVMVGHFGAPTRLGYTALGDGVNLAARLEPLCKQYNVEVLVSEAIHERADDAFAFRRIDRVAVKGKTEGIVVYELLGEIGDAISPVARTYEKALDAYLDRDFARAAELLEPQREDGPSDVLFERCRALEKKPPPATWGGVHVATTK